MLHGPNAAGKSTVARAIRFGLLLPPKASAIDPWVPWSGGGDPTVTLVFRIGPTQFWRVRKVFGTTSASLDRSSDGVAWTNEARAREVESRIRALLQWGIPEPGGSGAPRGVPESFLANALLADQDMVSAIFDRDLEGDTADSGRARIRAAIQAVASDPLFKSVLDITQAQVDRAFTATGQRKRGANDPFQRIADDVRKRQAERDAAAQVSEHGRTLTARVAELQESAVEAEGAFHQARTNREALEARRERRRTLDAAITARTDGTVRLEAAAEAERRVAHARAVLQDREPKMPGLRIVEQESRKIFEAATAEASMAREKRKAEIAQEETAILLDENRLRERRAEVDAALARTKADALRAETAVLAAHVARLDVELQVLDLVDPWIELSEAKASLAGAEVRMKEAAEWLAKANELRSKAAAEGLPAATDLARLRSRWNELDVAKRQLEVGLAIEVKGAPAATIAVDGGDTTPKSPPFTAEATASAILTIGAVEVIVRGGRPTARADAERLSGIWRDETASLFADLAVPDLAALEQRRQDADSLLRQADAADAKRVALGDPAGDTSKLSTRITEFQARISGADLTAVEAAAASGASTARKLRDKKVAEREKKNEARAAAQAEETALRARIPVADGSAIANPAAVQAEIEAASKLLAARALALGKAKAALDSPPESRGALEHAALEARKALETAVTEVSEAKVDHEVWTARLDERRRGTAGIDIAALTVAESAAQAAAVNAGLVNDGAIIPATAAENAARIRLDGLLVEVGKAEGALAGSGGAAAEERLREFEEALHRAHEKQAQDEDDFEAWRMLLEALQVAERTQATHLGNVFVPDLVTRFQSLSGARYSGVALGPPLALEGVDSEGARRDLDRLSIGTQEQLSTIFRLCLAERLKSALLLDDQLVQSDPDRLRWFRRALRDTAKKGVQIIVLTCRPADYLEYGESPAPVVRQNLIRTTGRVRRALDSQRRRRMRGRNPADDLREPSAPQAAVWMPDKRERR